MKTLRSSTGAKTAAAVLLFLLLLSTCVGMVFIFIFDNYNVYRTSEEELRRRLYETAADETAVRAVQAYRSGNMDAIALPEGIYMAIAEGTEALTADQVRNAEIVYGAIPHGASSGDMYVTSLTVSDSSDFYRVQDFLGGDRVVLAENSWVDEDFSVDELVRSGQQSRTLLLRSGNDLYPLSESICQRLAAADAFEVYRESSRVENEPAVYPESYAAPLRAFAETDEPYELYMEKYARSGVSAQTVADEPYELEAEEYPEEAEALKAASGRWYLINWSLLVNEDALPALTPEQLQTYTRHENIRIEEFDSLWMTAHVLMPDPTARTYSVAFAFTGPAKAAGSVTNNDAFVKMEKLLAAALLLRLPVLLVTPGCALFALLLFIFLMVAAGFSIRRSGELTEAEMHYLESLSSLPGNEAMREREAFVADLPAEVVRPGLLALLPLDVTGVITAGLAFTLVMLVATAASWGWNSVSFWMAALLGGGAAYAMVLAWCMAFSVNVKLRRLGRNMLITRFFGFLGRKIRAAFAGLKAILANIKMSRRIWAIAVLVAACEFLGLVILRHDIEILMIVWVLEKLVFIFLIYRVMKEFGALKAAGGYLAAGNLAYKVDTTRMLVDFGGFGNDLNAIGEGMNKAVSERMQSERMKTELITNVSHDIKTPLTSIVSYADLLGKLDLENETAREYVEVITRQAARLKKLIEDLIEASKAQTGNLAVVPEEVDVGVMLDQLAGEYTEKMAARHISLLVQNHTEKALVMADSRHLFRVLDNLLGNMNKYAMPGTRAYIDLTEREISNGAMGFRAETGSGVVTSGTDAFGAAVHDAEAAGVSAHDVEPTGASGRGKKEYVLTFRNISSEPLHASGDELTERFVRGEASRTTEGSGLGLSIARSLTELMGGSFTVTVDGDLFKVEVCLR